MSCPLWRPSPAGSVRAWKILPRVLVRPRCGHALHGKRPTNDPVGLTCRPCVPSHQGCAAIGCEFVHVGPAWISSATRSTSPRRVSLTRSLSRTRGPSPISSSPKGPPDGWQPNPMQFASSDGGASRVCLSRVPRRRSSCQCACDPRGNDGAHPRRPSPRASLALR